MKGFILALSGPEVVCLLRAERAAAGGQPQLDVTCEKDFIIEENFDHNLYSIQEDAWLDLVTSIAVLTIEPRREIGDWVLSVVVERALGLVRTVDEREMTPRQLTLDEFETELRSARRKEVTVRLDVQSSDIKRDFDQWLTEMRARHRLKPAAMSSESVERTLRPEYQETNAGGSHEIKNCFGRALP